jgi:acyl-CoA thioester hydrolase
MSAPRPLQSEYQYFQPIGTRWADNDQYGHVNNVIYYAYFDTLVNECLIKLGVLDVKNGSVIGFVVQTHCEYHEAISFPDKLVGALRVATLGRSSVRYELAIFKDGDANLPAVANGHFLHVYVDRLTRRPVELPDSLRQVLLGLVAT